ncbi:MAG TPA: hypothetical protein PKC40_10105 [Saprospiraceae bacterium]|nr:hypothetical protein [Saprospiraceae bacterium]
MKKLSKILSIVSLIFALQFALPNDSAAQCPMCRMSAESNLKNGGTAGKGLNAGILYMLLTPYLLVGGLGYYWYSRRRKQEEEEMATEE